MDPELIAYLDERFSGIDERFRSIDERFHGMDASLTQQIQELRKETSSRFDRVEQRILETDIKVEALRDNIQQVAEGVAMSNQTLELFKKDVAREFKETKDLIRDGYRDLDRRVKVLEKRTLQS